MAKTISFEYGGKNYKLEYTLRTAGQCEQDGFVWDELGNKPATMIPLLFYWAFAKNHRGMNRKQASEIFEGMNHKTELVTALSEMYAEALSALVDEEEETEGNANWTVT